MQNGLIIAIGAGLASAALFASAWTGTMLGVFVLFFMSPLPVAIAGLGWGWAASVIAAAVGMAAVSVAGGGRSGIVYLTSLGAPAAIFSYFALLNRPVLVGSDGDAPDGEAVTATEWYPIGRLVAWASLWAGLTTAFYLLGISSDLAGLRATIAEMFEKTRLFEALATSKGPLTQPEKNGLVAVFAALMPWAIASIWFSVAMLNLWAAAHVILSSGRLSRPWPDLSAISLPPAMPLAFGAALLGTFVPDMPGLVAAGFASALMFAFMLVGLAILHRVTRGSGLRPAILGIVYGALIFLPPFSTLLVAMIGLAEPLIRRRFPPGAAPPLPPAT